MTAVDETQALSRFSTRIREATAAEHTAAEQSGFVRQLLRGRLTPEQYAQFVGQQYFVYRTLEDAALFMKDDPTAAPFVRRELMRAPSLEADLTFLLGADWQTRIVALSATRAYCDRLRDVCFTWAGGFLAHHYVRYMGDLSGGQLIGSIIKREYQLDDGSGASFYVFPAINDPNAFKSEYRRLLDDAEWDPSEQEQIIDEVRRAYRLNTDLFAELA